MIAIGSRTGWQTTLADLALILFMVTAAALAEQPEADPVVLGDEGVSAPPAQGEPLAIYRAAPQAPPLEEWLANQPQDGRQNLTIIARHRPGEAATAAQRALALDRAAAAAGRSARIVLEPSETDDLIAMLDFDGRRVAASSSAPASGTQIAGKPRTKTGTATAEPDER